MSDVKNLGNHLHSIVLYLYTAQYLVFAQHSDCCTKLSCMLPHALSELTNILYLIYLLFIYYWLTYSLHCVVDSGEGGEGTNKCSV